MLRTTARTTLAFLALTATTTIASAQSDYPNKPIRIIVGLAAGAINDVQARVVAAKLAERVKQPVVVENRTGAGGNIAAEFVARAAPDGYTLLMTPTATMAINPAVYTKLPYKSPDDFVAITQLSTYPLFLAVQQDLPVKNVKELLAHAKANPTKANLASPATFFDMVTALLTLDTGVKFEVIRFKSTPETMTALITGQAMIAFQEYRSLAPQLKAGKAKALATLSTTRSADLPDVPTIVEAGYGHAAAQPFSGIVAPAKTPPAIVKKLETEINAVLNSPDVKERWKSLGLFSVESSSEAFGKLIVSEIKRWKDVATKANIKLD